MNVWTHARGQKDLFIIVIVGLIENIYTGFDMNDRGVRLKKRLNQIQELPHSHKCVELL